MTVSTLHKDCQNEIISIWNAAWTHSTVPVYWHANDADPVPDPSTVRHFLRNEVDFGRETVRAFGGGRFANERILTGSVLLRVFAARMERSENTLLDLMSDAIAAFRSVRTETLSFIHASGFDESAAEDGNWYMRGSLVVFEYNFVG
jgi:hypothetical protein